MNNKTVTIEYNRFATLGDWPNGVVPTQGKTYTSQEVAEINDRWTAHFLHITTRGKELEEIIRDLRERVHDAAVATDQLEAKLDARNGKGQPRRRLKTREQVLRAIREVIGQMIQGHLSANDARARLYAFQTLLVAMQINSTATPATTTKTPGQTSKPAHTHDPEST